MVRERHSPASQTRWEAGPEKEEEEEEEVEVEVERCSW